MKVYGALENAQIESFLNSARPTSFNNYYRMIWVIDRKVIQVGDGITWVTIGSAGGGGSFQWQTLGGSAPVQSEEAGEVCYLFQNNAAQELYTTIRVPFAFAGATQIFLYVSAYTPSTANTILLQAQSTLIRRATDDFTSNANQRLSTNTAITNATTANKLQQFVLDLTDTTGRINSVAVGGGDIIRVRLFRATDTDTADIRLVPSGNEVTF